MLGIAYECLFAKVKYFMFDKGRGGKAIKRGRKEHLDVSLVFGQPLSPRSVCVGIVAGRGGGPSLRRVFTDHS